MKTCDRCGPEVKHWAKGLCRRCYYLDWNRRPEQKILNNKRAKKRNSDPEIKKQTRAREKQKLSERRNILYSFIPPVCALSTLSRCDHGRWGTLTQDHDHSCECKMYTGCQNCFRGLLCDWHNRRVLPMIEKLNEEHIPQIVKDYLKQRPLKGTDVFPVKTTRGRV